LHVCVENACSRPQNGGLTGFDLLNGYYSAKNCHCHQHYSLAPPQAGFFMANQPELIPASQKNEGGTADGSMIR